VDLIGDVREQFPRCETPWIMLRTAPACHTQSGAFLAVVRCRKQPENIGSLPSDSPARPGMAINGTHEVSRMQMSKKTVGAAIAVVAVLLAGGGAATAFASPGGQPSPKPTTAGSADPQGTEQMKMRAAAEEPSADAIKAKKTPPAGQQEPSAAEIAAEVGIDTTGMTAEQIEQAPVAFKVVLGAQSNGSYDSSAKDAIGRLLGIDTSGMTDAQITAAIEAKFGPALTHAVDAANVPHK